MGARLTLAVVTAILALTVVHVVAARQALHDTLVEALR